MPGMPREVGGKVLSLEVENFKSYRGQHSIGPFHAFTAVMGPNGSGKSNLMDAISFVLGVRGAQLRGSLNELLYSHNEVGKKEFRPERGHVSLVLETEELGTIRFTRAIIPGRNAGAWTSVYSVDEQTVSWSAYEAKLMSYGILVKTRNFLVFQGDIEAVAAKKPEDLTKLFESISGSEAFKADHDRLEVECKDAEANFLFVQSRKKSTAAAKKQKKEQKEEAEKHLKLQAELAKLKATYYLWQLFHAQQDSEQADKERAERQQLLTTAAEELQSIEAAVKDKKREVAGLSKQKILLEQKVKKRQAVVEKQSPEQIKAGIEKEHTARKIRTKEKELQTIQAKETDHEKKVTQLQKQLEDLEAAEEERTARRSSDGEMVDSATLSKYHRLMEEAKAKTARDRADLASLETVQTADQQTLKEQKETLQSIVARLAELRAAAENVAQLKEAQEQELKAAKQELEKKRHELGQQEIRNRRNKATRLAVEEKLRKLNEQIQDSRASKRDRDKETQAHETVAEMKRLFPGVHGRVSELAKVTQKSYNLALAVVMGSNIDSVVVDTERAAKGCVAYLKQRRIPPMTFIPLQTIKVKPPNERLRDNLRGIANLAFDLLEFDAKLENAFIYVCGNTFVCENEEDAKQLAFSGAERHKVVTKSGLLIAKSGAMTGGGTANLEAKAARFDEAHNMSLRQERAKLESELQGLACEQEGQRLYHHVQNEIRGLETKVALLEQEIQADKGRTAGNGVETQAMEKKRQEIEPQVEKLRGKVESQQSRVERIRKRMNEVEDRIFAPLSKEVGVASIREYIEANMAAVEKREHERISHARQTAKVRQQLEYEVKARKPETGKLLAELDRWRHRLDQLQQEERKASLAVEQVEEEVSSMVQDLERIKATISEAEKKLRELKKEESGKAEAGSRLQRAVRDLDTTLEALAVRQGDVLHMAQLEQIELPGLEEEDDEEEAAEPIDTDEVGEDAAKASRQQRASSSAGDREKLDDDFKKDIEERQAALASAAPNLKALEQYNEAKAKDEQEKVEVEEARQVRLEKVRAFQEVQQQRRVAFMAAFNHISAVIDPIYKDLTKSSEAGMGGSGYLSLQGSEDECYMTGTSFSVVPPGKRWRQMDELSGGEKTLAALALLFAIHSFKPSPFFVLDEIDAALDAKNVSKVANYIRSKTRVEGGQHEFQAVVISLKDSFFSKADALVGVTKEAHHGSSKTFTLDLNRFGEPEVSTDC